MFKDDNSYAADHLQLEQKFTAQNFFSGLGFVIKRMPSFYV
jgi:hypothetical protein